MGATGNSAYYARLQLDAGTYYFQITNNISAATTYYVRVALGSAPPLVYKLRIVWEDGEITATYNDSVTLTYSDMTYAAQEYCGLAGYSTDTRCTDFWMVGGSAVGLSVDPAIIPNFGTATTLTFTGTNTAWTAGTPGSPIITVDHGTLSGQEVVDADTITATYDPGAYLGSITFTDPSTGATVGAVVTSNPTYLPGDQCPFTPQAVAMVNNTAGESLLETLLKPTHSFTVGGASLDLETILGTVTLSTYAQVGQTPTGAPTQGLLFEIWDILNGAQTHSESVTIQEQAINAATRAQSILDELADFRTASDFTLQDVLDLLRGTGAVNHAEILAAVQAITGGDNSDVLALLQTIRGDYLTTLQGLRLQAEAIRTANDWTFGNVKTWIEAVESTPTDLTPAITAIANLASQLTSATASVTGDVAEVASDLTLVSTAISGLVELVTALANQGNMPPIITPDTVPTYATPVALAEAVQIDVPMAGVLIDVVGRPSGVREYPVGQFAMIFRAGYLAFINPLGYVEQPQYLSFTKGIYTPKTCTEAIGVLVKPNQGQTGTITPFTLEGA